MTAPQAFMHTNSCASPKSHMCQEFVRPRAVCTHRHALGPHACLGPSVARDARPDACTQRNTRTLMRA